MRRPLAIALMLSTLAHALLFAGLVGVPFVHLVASVPIEIVEMKRHAPAPPLPGTPHKTEPKSEPTRRPAHPATSAKPEKPSAPPAPDLRGVGPSGANLTLILRTTTLRTSVHREGVESLLSLLPDYHTLLDGTNLSLFDDLSALLIATPDPRDVAATFLAARHRVDPRFDHIMEKPLGPDDPRQFRALGADLTVLGPPVVVTRLEDEDDAESRRWMEALRGFDATATSAALELTIADLPELVRFEGPVPMPRSIDLSASADPSPFVHLVCTFDATGEAKRFYSLWPMVQARAGEAAPMFSGVLDGVKARLEGRTVELTGTLPEPQVALALSLARLFAPKPPESGPTDMR